MFRRYRRKGDARHGSKKLALIHIVKKELGLSDEEYREILRREAGVDSAKDLTDESFRQLMRFLVRSRHYHGTYALASRLVLICVNLEPQYPL